MRNVALALFGAAFLCGCASDSVWKRQAFAFSQPGDPPKTNSSPYILALRRVSISPLFQTRSFTYRTGEHSYEQDPYAGFLIPPERALAEAIRAWLRAGGVFGRVAEPGSGLAPNLIAEVSINQLYGDLRTAPRPVAAMEIHFVCYELKDEVPERVMLDRVYSQETPMTRKTPGALMAAWDADLQQIMAQVNGEFAKTISSNR